MKMCTLRNPSKSLKTSSCIAWHWNNKKKRTSRSPCTRFDTTCCAVAKSKVRAEKWDTWQRIKASWLHKNRPSVCASTRPERVWQVAPVSPCRAGVKAHIQRQPAPVSPPANWVIVPPSTTSAAEPAKSEARTFRFVDLTRSFAARHLSRGEECR